MRALEEFGLSMSDLGARGLDPRGRRIRNLSRAE